jgi:hypothetical protein
MLNLPHPFELLVFTSTLLTALEPPRVGLGPERADADAPEASLAEIVTSFIETDLRETTALLSVFAELLADEVLATRIGRELATRHHKLPRWLIGLGPVEVHRALQTSHVLGDGDNVILGVRTGTGANLSVVVYIDHNMGTVVKDAVVLPETVETTVESFSKVACANPDLVIGDLGLADARARITEATELGRITYPPFESDTWPECRPLVEWLVRQLPTGGRAYERPEWSDEDRNDLAERFFASPTGRTHDNTDDRGLLESLLWFACDYGPGDPLRWSPVAVEILMTDWLPRKVMADVGFLTMAPDLLRSFIRFCHSQRGIREALTVETLAAVDEWEPEYQRVIRSPRPQGPAALLAALGVEGPWDTSDGVTDALADLDQHVFDRLCDAVGGEDRLFALDAGPLPDEAFAWHGVADDVAAQIGEVLALVDRCCDEMLDAEYGTACRRLLADVATADPTIFRRGRINTAAAAIVWLVGKANDLFYEGGLTTSVGDLMAWLDVSGTPSQRARTMLAALGVDNTAGTDGLLATPRYLVSGRRAALIGQRDRLADRLEGADPPRDAIRPAGGTANELDQTDDQRQMTGLAGLDVPVAAGIDPAAPDPWADTPVPAFAATAWFPPAQFAEALRRWPHLRDRWGTDQYPVYARVVQGELLDAARMLGERPVLAPINVDELVSYATGIGADPADSTARTMFAADLARRELVRAWPPTRNEPCWCGSGRKYKKCCDTVATDPQRRIDPTATATAAAYEFDIRLAGATPPVWRRIQLSADATFGDLHRAVQLACGWTESHLFVFRTAAGDVIAGSAFEDGFDDPEPDANAVPLSRYFARHDACVYEYDFGDSWIHDIELRDRIDGPVDFTRRLINGDRAFPPEDCGGMHGYEQCVAVAAAGSDDEGLRVWLGDWHPEDFDLQTTKRVFDS